MELNSQTATLRIYATDKQGNEQEITDLYWFEEQGVIVGAAKPVTAGSTRSVS